MPVAIRILLQPYSIGTAGAGERITTSLRGGRPDADLLVMTWCHCKILKIRNKGRIGSGFFLGKAFQIVQEHPAEDAVVFFLSDGSV